MKLFPMRRNLPQPLDTGVLHRRSGVETFGDGPVDDGSFLLLQQRDGLFLESYKSVNPAGLAVEEVGNGGLLGERGKGINYICKLRIFI